MKLKITGKFTGLFTFVLILALSAACGSTPSTGVSAGSTTPTAVEPRHAGNLTDAVRITWVSNSVDPQWWQQHLDLLHKALGQAGWPVRLDVLPTEYEQNPGGYTTDAFIASADDAVQLYKDGVTMDAAQLCEKVAPVLSGKYADLLQPAGIPLGVSRDVSHVRYAFYLLRDKAPQQWLVTPPALSDIVTWIEENDVKIGRGMPGIATPMPFATAIGLWAAEQGYYPADCLSVRGGFYLKFSDATLQLVPLENISGFDAMYSRLVDLFNAGKFFDAANMSPKDTDGYLTFYPAETDVDSDYLAAKGLTGSDFIAITVKGADWRQHDAAPDVNQVMAIPVNGAHGEQALKLAEWALTGREGYDLVNYGIKDQDYTLEADRLKLTDSGKGMSIYHILAWDDAMERLSVNAPSNAADLKAGDTAVMLPFVDYPKIMANKALPSEQNPINAVSAGASRLISERENLLMGLMPSDIEEQAQPVTDAPAALRLLRALDRYDAVDNLARAYDEEISKLIK